MLRLVDGVAALLHRFGALILIPLLTAIITVDVGMRYVLNDPIVWSIEANEILLLWIFFASLPFVTRHGGHIRMELVHRHLRGVARYVANLVWCVAGLFFSVLLTWRVFGEIPRMIAVGEASDYISFPTALVYAFVGVAGALMSLMFVVVLVLGPERAGSHSGDPEARLAHGENAGGGA